MGGVKAGPAQTSDEGTGRARFWGIYFVGFVEVVNKTDAFWRWAEETGEGRHVHPCMSQEFGEEWISKTSDRVSEKEKLGRCGLCHFSDKSNNLPRQYLTVVVHEFAGIVFTRRFVNL